MTLSNETVRGLLAIIVVGGTILVCGALAILPLLGGAQNAKDFAAMLKDFGGLFSGIVGAVMGYYFGKSADK